MLPKTSPLAKMGLHYPAMYRKVITHINVDLVDPIPPSLGRTHIFTIVERTTR